MSKRLPETIWLSGPGGVLRAVDYQAELDQLRSRPGWLQCEAPTAEQLAGLTIADQERAAADAEAAEQRRAHEQAVKQQAREQQASKVAAEIAKAQGQS